jgi:hypothetical protein
MDYLQLRSFDNYINASLTLARLDEEGITCYLKDEFTVTIDPFLSNAVGGIKLMVLPDDFEEAKTLLAGYDKDYRESVTCPQCGAYEIEYINKPGVKNWVSVLVSWFLLRYPLASEQVYHCYKCEFEFIDLPEDPVSKQNV